MDLWLCYLVAVVAVPTAVRSVAATVPTAVRSVAATVPTTVRSVAAIVVVVMVMVMVADVAGITAIANDAIIAAISDDATICKSLVYKNRTCKQYCHCCYGHSIETNGFLRIHRSIKTNRRYTDLQPSILIIIPNFDSTTIKPVRTSVIHIHNK